MINGEKWICIKGMKQETNFVCIFNLVFRLHESVEKCKIRNELLEVNYNLEAPLLMMGDFNEVLKVEDKSGNRGLTRNMEEFRTWVNDTNFIKLPHMGRNYTWRRGRSYSH